MSGSEQAITNVRCFNGTELTDPATVVYSGGGIVGVESDSRPADGERVADGDGATLLPGLIDAHVHLDGRGNLEDAARWGVTTMLDMGTSSPDLIARLRNQPGLPQIFSSQSPASAPGGMQTTVMGFDPATALATSAEAEPFVAARAAEGADYVKIILEDPDNTAALDVERATALVEAAHARDFLVYAHVTTVPAVRIAVDAGVDVLTHMPIDAVLDDALVESIVADGSVAVPTLTMMRGAVAMAGARTHPGAVDFANAEMSVAALDRASVPVLAGTDSNASPAAPFHVSHGSSLHDELELLVAAGLSSLDAVRAATVLPSRHLGLGDRGSIAAGRRADFVLVDGDPLADITATRRIRGVWIAGERVR